MKTFSLVLLFLVGCSGSDDKSPKTLFNTNPTDSQYSGENGAGPVSGGGCSQSYRLTFVSGQPTFVGAPALCGIVGVDRGDPAPDYYSDPYESEGLTGYRNEAKLSNRSNQKSH